jgi:agmatine deiminase
MAFPTANASFGRAGSQTLDASSAAVDAQESFRVASHETPLNDAWLRDSDPTFVDSPDGESLIGVEWIFNGWGTRGWSAWGLDQRIAARVIELAGAVRSDNCLVNEGEVSMKTGEAQCCLPKRSTWIPKAGVTKMPSIFMEKLCFYY